MQRITTTTPVALALLTLGILLALVIQLRFYTLIVLVICYQRIAQVVHLQFALEGMVVSAHPMRGISAVGGLNVMALGLMGLLGLVVTWTMFAQITIVIIAPLVVIVILAPMEPWFVFRGRSVMLAEMIVMFLLGLTNLTQLGVGGL